MSQEKDEEKEQEVKPDESSGFAVQGHLKIFDPETGEVIVAKRG
jgi:hypothetical protein